MSKIASKIFPSKAFLIGILAAIIPACALDAEGPDGSEADGRAGADPSAADAETMSDAEALALAALPTCNSVRNWHGGFVPDVSSTSSVDCDMGLNAHSSAVGQLQRTMNLCYGEHLTVDDDFGSLTEAALVRTQKKAGTQADGVYGPNTRKAMLHQSTVNAKQCVRVP
jgi:hypothetical protein